MITRYAYIVDGQTVWGPGPMPYFITLQDGMATMWEITAHSVEENEAVGIFIVEQINYREIDERFEQAYVPLYEIVDGRPRETWSYHFIPAARNNMVDGIDEHAEKIREVLATKYSGQYSEYNEAYAEALEIAELPANQTIAPGTYKYIDADVGVTYSFTLNRVVQTIREAAELVIETRAEWKNIGANLRIARLATKKRIREAQSDKDAFVIYNEFVATTLPDYV